VLLQRKSQEPELFRSGRQFAAWLGLTPKDHATAGKVRPGVITQAGDAELRSVLAVGGYQSAEGPIMPASAEAASALVMAEPPASEASSSRSTASRRAAGARGKRRSSHSCTASDTTS
jgi:hypothetical protein